MEYWDIYDESNSKTGRIKNSSDQAAKGEYHMVVHLCIFNSKNQMLIQKRQKTKSYLPGLWGLSCGGRAIAGETSQEAIKRELEEELGLDLDFAHKRPLLTLNFARGFNDIYAVKLDHLRLEDLSLQLEEVEEVAWASRRDIKDLLQEGEFIPIYESLADLFFDMQDHYGWFPKETGL